MFYSALRRTLLSTAAIAVVASSCAQPPKRVSTNTVPAPTASAADRHVIAQAYAERLRLGLGSPFRLMEMALRDERLGSEGRAVAMRLFETVLDHRSYDISASVLTGVGASATSAVAQTLLISEAIERAPDAAAGERAVALAYDRAVRDSVVSQDLANRAIRMAALFRDRRLAEEDAAALSRIAAQMHVAPVDLILKWRHDLRFAVERPSLQTLSVAELEAADHLALLLAGGVRAAAEPVSSEFARTLPAPLDSLPAAAAERIADNVNAGATLPQNALTTVLRAEQKAVRGTRARAAAPYWQDFFERAGDEESFVAWLALSQRDSADARVAAAIALDAAIALRPFAQERMLGRADSVSTTMLRERYGVRTRIATDVPPAWRRQTLFELDHALADFFAAVPTAQLKGLTIEIGRIPRDARYQAYHDPVHRVLRIDPATAAGTLAHEIGHDLDWQLAHRRYGTTSSYATDYAVRKRTGIAYLVRNLAEEDRPAEVFARRFEWYVAAALAARGRMNGYLSSVQNGWLTGYGSAVRPDAAPVALDSFIALLGDAALMSTSERAYAKNILLSDSVGRSPGLAQQLPGTDTGWLQLMR